VKNDLIKFKNGNLDFDVFSKWDTTGGYAVWYLAGNSAKGTGISIRFGGSNTLHVEIVSVPYSCTLINDGSKNTASTKEEFLEALMRAVYSLNEVGAILYDHLHKPST
jgi:hypothetical protein